MNFIHESIFVSSLRTFTKTIFAIFGLALGIFAVILSMSVLSSPYVETYKPQILICPTESGDTNLHPSAPVILKVTIEGMIGTKKLNTETITQALLKSKQVIKPERIKGLFLTINSPGGTTIDSAGIYQAISEFKEANKIPVYAHVDGLCASGGMYIACSSDYIGATSESIVGSVGVRMGPLFNFKDLISKVGIDALTITQGKDKDSFNPFRKWNVDEGEDIKALIKESYESFVDVVTSARKNMSKEALMNVYGAQIYSSKTAMTYGYIDQSNISYFQTLQLLRKASGIEDKTAYQVLEITPYKSPLEDIMESKLGFLTKSFKEHLTDYETKNPICDRVFYLMDF